MNPVKQQQIKIGILAKSLKEIVLEAASHANMDLGALDDLSRSMDSIAVGIGIQSTDLRVHVVPVSTEKGKLHAHDFTLVGRNLDKGVGYEPLGVIKEHNAFGADPNLHLDSARNYWNNRLQQPDAQAVLNQPNSALSTTVAPTA